MVGCMATGTKLQPSVFTPSKAAGPFVFLIPSNLGSEGLDQLEMILLLCWDEPVVHLAMSTNIFSVVTGKCYW